MLAACAGALAKFHEIVPMSFASGSAEIKSLSQELC